MLSPKFLVRQSCLQLFANCRHRRLARRLVMDERQMSDPALLARRRKRGQVNRQATKAAADRKVEARSLADRTGPLGRIYILVN